MTNDERNEPPSAQSSVRSLKIEADGDRWKGIKPKIRIMGKWLERAGFKPGSRVHVKCVAPGFMELCAEPSESKSDQASDGYAQDHPDVSAF